jgi:small-conductance mechanosensitive channel
MPFNLDIDNALMQQVFLSLILLVGVGMLVRLGHRLVARYVEEPSRRYHASKMVSRIGGLVALVIVLIIWSPGERNVITLLTVIGAGLAIAMREALLSVVGWMSVILRNLYRQSDRIEVNGICGDVIDIRLFHTTLMEVGGWVDADQSTGRIVHVPNSWIYQHGVFNYTRGFSFIWNEIAITVTYRSDWRAAREIMLSLAQESAAVVEQQAAREIRQMAREYLVHYGILSPFVYVRVTGNGVRLTLRYLCEVRKRRGTEHAITLSLLDAFREHGGIEIAYATTSVALYDSPQFGPLPPGEGGGVQADAQPGSDVRS